MTTDPTTRAAQRIADIIAEETTEHGHVEPNTMERWREVILGERDDEGLADALAGFAFLVMSIGSFNQEIFRDVVLDAIRQGMVTTREGANDG